MYNIQYIRGKIVLYCQCEVSFVTIRNRTFKQLRDLPIKDMIKSACIYVPAWQGRYLEI